MNQERELSHLRDLSPQESTTDPARLLQATGRWRAREVSYWSGKWDRLSRLVPTFSLEPFRLTPETPANPYLSAVLRLPLNVTENLIPVATVSNSYQLAQHHDVIAKCFEGLRFMGMDIKNLDCEVGLTALGEWMNFRAYFPGEYDHKPKDGHPIRLRMECFNSVDGSSKLEILFGWYRFVCSNGLVIGETKAELKDTHDKHLDLDVIPSIIATGFMKVQDDIKRLRNWEESHVSAPQLERWANKTLTEAWGKKAACRAFHICLSGCDVKILDPFAKGEATEKPVEIVNDVPGAAKPAQTLYDVSQALSWLATNRNNTEERVQRQSDIPRLIDSLRNLSRVV